MGRKKKGELSGADYVKFKCDILKDMRIGLPPENEIQRLGSCSIIAIDNYFHSLMCPKIV